jgi:hypothetical protein
MDPALVALQFGGFLDGPLGQLLLALVAVALVLLVGRVLLNVAWRLVTIAVVVVALLWLASVFLPL